MKSSEWIEVINTSMDLAKTNRAVATGKANMEKDGVTLESIKKEEEVIYVFWTDADYPTKLSEPVSVSQDGLVATQEFVEVLYGKSTKLVVVKYKDKKILGVFEQGDKPTEMEEPPAAGDDELEATSFEKVEVPELVREMLELKPDELKNLAPNLADMAGETSQLFRQLVALAELKRSLVEDGLLSSSLSEAFKRAQNLGSLKRIIESLLDSGSDRPNYSLNAVPIMHTMKWLVDSILDPTKDTERIIRLAKRRV